MESVMRGSAYAEEIAMKNEGNILTSFLITTVNPLRPHASTPGGLQDSARN